MLPKGFVKVRYFGLIAPGCRKRLAALRQQLEQKYPENLDALEATPESVASDPQLKPKCLNCGQPMLLQRMIQLIGRCPP